MILDQYGDPIRRPPARGPLSDLFDVAIAAYEKAERERNERMPDLLDLFGPTLYGPIGELLPTGKPIEYDGAGKFFRFPMEPQG